MDGCFKCTMLLLYVYPAWIHLKHPYTLETINYLRILLFNITFVVYKGRKHHMKQNLFSFARFGVVVPKVT